MDAGGDAIQFQVGKLVTANNVATASIALHLPWMNLHFVEGCDCRLATVDFRLRRLSEAAPRARAADAADPAATHRREAHVHAEAEWRL